MYLDPPLKQKQNMNLAARALDALENAEVDGEPDQAEAEEDVHAHTPRGADVGRDVQQRLQEVLLRRRRRLAQLRGQDRALPRQRPARQTLTIHTRNGRRRGERAPHAHWHACGEVMSINNRTKGRALECRGQQA